MKTHEPKMILNLSLESDELEKKIEIAMKEYIEKLSLDKLEYVVARYVDKKISSLVNDSTLTWNRGTIKGQTLDSYIAQKVEGKIETIIDQNIKEILARKLAALI